jgi:ligand-binding sensor domain-containing protein/two-component sensor histidine kinase
MLRAMRRIGLQDGLAELRVKRIFQDSKGLIWLNTVDGFQRFDGRRFMTLNYGMGDDGGQIASGIMNFGIDEDAEGNIWSVTEHEGPLAYDTRKGQLRMLDLSSLSKTQLRTHAICHTRGGEVFASSIGGLLRVRNFKVEPVPVDENIAGSPDMRNTRDIVADSSGVLWIASSAGFLRYDPQNQKWQYPGNNPQQHRILNQNSSISAILLDEHQQIWYSTWNHIRTGENRYLYRYSIIHNQLDSVLLPATPVNGNEFYNLPDAMLSDRRGNILIASQGGQLFHYDQAMQWKASYAGVVVGDDKVAFESISSLYCDRDGNIWLGCQDGLFLFPALTAGQRRSISLSPPEFAWQQHFTRLKHGTNGDVVINTLGAPLRYWNSERSDVAEFNNTPVKGKWKYYQTWLTRSGDNHYFCPWFTDEVVRWNSKTGQYYPFLQAGRLGHLAVKALPLQEGLLLLGRQHLFRTDNYGKIQDSLPLHETQTPIVHWTIDSAGIAWAIDQQSVIYRIAITPTLKWEKHSTAALRGDNFRIAVFNNHIIVGTHYQGLAILDYGGKIVRQLTRREGLLSNIIEDLFLDREGTLWIKTPVGFNYLPSVKEPQVLSVSELDRRFTDYLEAGYDGENGFFLLYRDKIEQVFPLSIRPGNQPPFLFTRLKTGNQVRLPDNEKKLVLDWTENELDLEFAALDYMRAPMIQYRYSLGGDWNYLGNEGRIFLPSLKPGSYQLAVAYRQPNGDWTEQPLQFAFQIRAPFWSRPWFIILATLLCLSPMLIWWWRKNQEQRKIAQIRWQLSRDLHDDVGSTLSSIGIYSSVLANRLKDEKELTILQDIREKASGTIQEMADIVWAIQPENDKLHNFLQRFRSYAIPLLENSGIKIEWNDQAATHALSLPMLQRRNLYLVCKEALTNTLKYAGATKFRFDCYTEGNQLLIRIEDDGKGFSESELNRQNGLSNMRQRISEIGGQIQIKSEPGAGTHIQIKLS